MFLSEVAVRELSSVLPFLDISSNLPLVTSMAGQRWWGRIGGAGIMTPEEGLQEGIGGGG